MTNQELRDRMDAAIAKADRITMLQLADIAALQSQSTIDHGDGPGVYAFTAYSEIFGEAEI